MKKAMIVAIIVVLCAAGCVNGKFQPIAWFTGTVCDNQDIADAVKARAKEILDKCYVALDQLNIELESAQDAVVILAIKAAILATQKSIDGAYHLVYEVLCPTSEELTTLEQRYALSKSMAARAIKAAKKGAI